MKKRICILAALALTMSLTVPALTAGEETPGPLRVEGTRLVDESGEPVRLRGVSVVS